MDKELDLILITNEIEMAAMAEFSGVQYLMVDLEKNGKKERQGHLNTFISSHIIDDVKAIRKKLLKSKLLVRINPIYIGSQQEIDVVIESGADAVMLPMFTSEKEVEKFIQLINGRAETILLFETAQSLVRIDKILDISGIDIAYIGLNDLHLALQLDFMFELLSGGIVEYMANKIIERNIRFGFGGIAKVGEGALPAEFILREHARLGSNLVILSRTFKSNNSTAKMQEFADEINKVKYEYNKALHFSRQEQYENKRKIKELVDVLSHY